MIAPLFALALLAQAGTGLTAAPQLARAYDAIFDARFEEVPALLAAACPPAPREACQLLDAVALWWEMQLDPAGRTLDARFATRVDAAIAGAEAWAAREPGRAEAWFYVGAAYAARVQWRVARGAQVAAARDGKRIKGALERALAIDPSLDDAYFGIGLYQYYADVAPAAARLLRWLLALPGGDRRAGLAAMQRARAGGRLLRSEADYQMHLIDLWYEEQPERALALLAQLRARHPHNPHFAQAAAEAEDVYLHDPTASLHSYLALLDAGTDRRVAAPDLTRAAAHLGAARQLEQLFETDAAIPHLQAVIAAGASAPAGAVAEAQRLLQRAHARLTSPAYRLSLDGWRALQRGDLDTAERALTAALARDARNPVIRYRYAKLLLARQRDEDALLVLADVHRRHDETPAEIYTLACIDAARVKERQGDLRVASDLYRSATTVFGGDRRQKAEAQREYERLSTRLP